MEPLGGVASIIAVLQLTGAIVKVCKDYINGVKDYPKELRVVYLQIKSLAVIFETLRFMDTDDPEDRIVLSHLAGPIEGCRTVVAALSTLISFPSAITHKDQGSKRQRLQVSLATLAWPPKSDQARKLMEELNQYKSTIDMAIGGIVL